MIWVWWEKNLIHPQNKYLFWLDLIVGIAGMMSLVYDFYYVLMGEANDMHLSTFLLPIFVIDMGKKSITKYYSQLTLISNPWKILKKYLI